MRLIIHQSQLIIHRQQISDKLFFSLAVLFNHYAHIAPWVERITPLLHFRRRRQFAQAGDVFVLRLGEALLQPVDVLVVTLGGFYFLVQRFERGLERFGLAVSGGALALGPGLLGLLLLVVAHGLVQRFQSFVQGCEERIERSTQRMLGGVFLIDRFFLGVFFQIARVLLLQFWQGRPLRDQFRHGLLGTGVTQHFHKLLRDRLDMGLVLGELLHALREVAVHETYEFLAPALVQAADDGDVLNLLLGELAVGAVDLGENVARVDEQDVLVLLGLVEEPQRGRQRDPSADAHPPTGLRHLDPGGAARRVPAQVIGDGKSTVRQLVAEINKDPRRSDGHSTVMSVITLDAVADDVLAQQGFTVDSIPQAGHIVLIRRNANLSTGGTACDVTDSVHPEVAARAVEAARIIGLDIAGVDVIARDISVSLEAQNGGIVEVNAGPGLRMHLQPSEGTPRPVGEAIIDMLFATGDNGRVPVVAVTGVNGKTTTTRLVGHILSQQGKRVGMTTTDGVFIGARRIDDGDCSGPQSARKVLTHPMIDAAVLETARGGMLREGLAFDACDVAVVTNIGEGDHLGLGQIHTLKQLAEVKRIPVDAVDKSGSAVLNADDPLVVDMAGSCRGSVVYFSHSADNPLLVQRRAEEGRVVFTRDGALVLAHGTSEFSLITLDRVPLTHAGKIKFQVENVMAAVAATWALGVPAAIIRAGLETFAPSLESSPGRFNLFQVNGATVVVDYGHNPSALKSVLEAIAGFTASRRMAVYSAAGDRRDSDMIEQGRLLGDNFDRVLLYEGSYVRDRERGDIIKLFGEGLQQGARCKEQIGFPTWREAAQRALDLAQSGDVILIQADEVDESVAFFREIAANLPERKSSIKKP